jgi:glutaredoxin
MALHLVVYTRATYCPDQQRARKLLAEWRVPYQEIDCSKDLEALERIQQWNGHLGVPAIVVAEEGSVLPFREPDPKPVGRSTRDYNRGSLITEPSEEGLRQFLKQHALLPNGPQGS